MTKEEWFKQTLKLYIDRVVTDPVATSGHFELDVTLGWTARIVKQTLKDLGYSLSEQSIDEDCVEIRYVKNSTSIKITYSIFDFDLYVTVMQR